MRYPQFPYALVLITDGHGQANWTRKTITRIPDGRTSPPLNPPAVHPIGGYDRETPEAFVRRTRQRDHIELLESIDAEVEVIQGAVEDRLAPHHARFQLIRQATNRMSNLLEEAANGER